LNEAPGPHERPDNDIQWTRIIELDFVPHPRLTRPEIVRMDYAMEGNAIRMRVRAAWPDTCCCAGAWIVRPTTA